LNYWDANVVAVVALDKAATPRRGRHNHSMGDVGDVIIEQKEVVEPTQHGHQQSLSYEGSLGAPEFQQRSSQPIK
jgi:hypothetical protein